MIHLYIIVLNGDCLMNKEQELKNLDMMLSNGLISQKIYEIQKNLVLKKYPDNKDSSSLSVPKEKSPLTSISLKEAWKFSFCPLVFFSTLVYLLIISFLGIIVLNNAFSDLDLLMGNIFMGENFLIKNINVLLIGFAILMTSFWLPFFTRNSLISLGQSVETFEIKKLLIKILAYATCTMAFCLIFYIIGFASGRAFLHINFNALTRSEKLFTLTSILSIGCFFIITTSYLKTAVLTGLVGSFKTFKMVFFQTLSCPKYIFIFWGGALLNFLFFLILSCITGFIVKHIINLSADIISIFSFSTFVLYALSIAIIFVAASKRIRKVVKLSFLCTIPSFILLLVLPIPSFILTISFVLGYLAIMQLFWGMLYVIYFMAIQFQAFMAHTLTQIWCQVMGKKVIITSSHAQEKKVSEQKNQNFSDTPPYVFR